MNTVTFYKDVYYALFMGTRPQTLTAFADCAASSAPPALRPLYVHQAVSPPLGPAVPIGQHAPPCMCASSRGGGAGSSPPNLATRDPRPATRLAERAPVGYITPTIRPLRGARWLLTTLLTGFPTTGRANAVFCPRGAAAWTAAIRACPRRWSAAGRASGAC
jgi:hypothetical protein